MLYVIPDQFPPFRADVVDLFGKQMPARGHIIDWLMLGVNKFSGIRSSQEWLGNHVYLYPKSKYGGLPGRILSNIYGLIGDLMILPLSIKGQYSVIQVRDKIFAGLISWCAARLTGARFVYWMSFPIPEAKIYQANNKYVPYRWFVWLKGQSMRLFLYKAVLPLADHIFVQSDRMREDVANAGISFEKMTPIPMGIRKEQVRKPENARAPNTQEPLLLYLGVIMKLRQTEMLVGVLAKVRERYPKARLLLVGEAQHPGDILAVNNEVARLGLTDAVSVTGFLPMEQAWAWVEKADICISPFAPIPVLLSTSPTKLIEYLAMAKCVVANEHPEQCKVMHESGVGACIPWDISAFSDEICKLLDAPDSARIAASKGPEWVLNNRTYDLIAEITEEKYSNIITGK